MGVTSLLLHALHRATLRLLRLLLALLLLRRSLSLTLLLELRLVLELTRRSAVLVEVLVLRWHVRTIGRRARSALLLSALLIRLPLLLLLRLSGRAHLRLLRLAGLLLRHLGVMLVLVEHVVVVEVVPRARDGGVLGGLVAQQRRRQEAKGRRGRRRQRRGRGNHVRLATTGGGL